MMPGYGPASVTRSLVAPHALYPGAAFLVPTLATPGAASWWHVDRLVPLVGTDSDEDRVRVILAESDHRGRPYRVELDAADCVVWAATLAPATLAPPRLGHYVNCSTPWCGRTWGYLPVTVFNTVCFRCDTSGPVGI